MAAVALQVAFDKFDPLPVDGLTKVLDVQMGIQTWDGSFPKATLDAMDHYSHPLLDHR